MKLATLLRRSGTAENFTMDEEAAERLDENAALRREWDHLRNAAGTEAERTEIDAFFSRAMP
jgi:hypothetical protein